ncbi:MAG: hypothetical protein WA996_22180 [Candidatus Promineifilaceae bacterium]
MQRRRLILSKLGWSAALTTLLLAVAIGLNVASGAPSIIEVRVHASSDDSEERPVGTISTGSADLDLVEDSTEGIQIVGIRFSRVEADPGIIDGSICPRSIV